MIGFVVLAMTWSLAACTTSGGAPVVQPATRLHYAPNNNVSGGRYAPGGLGFNLADTSSKGATDALPGGVKALVDLGLCGGADAAFTSAVQPYVGDGHVFGFYLIDDPDPTGQYKTRCPASNLKAEADWIHQHDPGAVTFIVLMNVSSSKTPSFQNTYSPANTDIDLYGLDPYPCRSETRGCNYSMIEAFLTAAEQSGIPPVDIVPLYQAFGGGAWADDGGGVYVLPTAVQEAEILNTWGHLTPSPMFDYAYSWGVQRGDIALSDAPSSLQRVFAGHNARPPA